MKLTLGLFVLLFMLSPAAWAVSEHEGDQVDEEVQSTLYTPLDGGAADGQLLDFAGAWQLAAAEGGSVTLQQDVLVAAEDAPGDIFVQVPEDGEVLLDLNGHRLEGEEVPCLIYVGARGKLTVTDGGQSGSQIIGVVGVDESADDPAEWGQLELLGDAEVVDPNVMTAADPQAEYTPASGGTPQPGTFTAVWNKAAKSGGSVKLQKDVTADASGSFGTGDGFESNGAIKVPKDREITLDLNDHTLNRALDFNSNSSSSTDQVISVYGKLTLEDNGPSGTGKITGGRAGAVCVNSNAEFNMYSGIISGNVSGTKGSSLSNYAGGVSVSGTFNMYGGSITENKASNGAGVKINAYSNGSHGVFNMYGGEIVNNTRMSYMSTISAGVYVGSEYVDACAEFNISGNIKIQNNNYNDYNVYLPKTQSNEYPSINVIGELDSTSRIGISAKDVTDDNPVLVVKSDDASYFDINNFFSDDDTCHIELDDSDNKNIFLKAGPAPHGHALNVGCDSTITAGAEEVEFAKKLSSDSSKQLCVDGSVAVIDQYDIDLYNQGTTYVNSCYFLPEGEYYLAEDIVVDKPIVVQGNVKLCLNGNIIQGYNLDYSLMFVAPNAVLDLCDCNPETTHTGFDEITVTGGILTGGNAHRTESRPSTAYSHGGGINVYGSTLNMYGGTIYKNRAIDANGDAYHEGGGIYCSGFNSGSDHYTVYFNMYGGAIIGNSACNGGGVYFSSGNDAEFNVYGGIIEGNTANINGAGVYNASNFIMHGGKIRNNRAEPYKSGYGGDGAGVLNTGRFTMKGGVITGNIAKRNGGGVYHTKNDNWPFPQSFTVSGNPQIYDNIGTYYQIPDDFYSAKGYIMIDNSGLEDGAKIGVRKDPNQTTNRMVAALFDEQAGYNSEYLKYFFADESNKYHIEATR